MKKLLLPKWASAPYVTQSDVDKFVEVRKSDSRLTQPALEPAKGPGSYFHTRFYHEIAEAREAAGAHAEIQSNVFFPTLDPTFDPKVVEEALSLVPRQVRPRKRDRAETLARRVAKTGFFDELMALAHGNGRKGAKRLRLNQTEYPQPRRKAWSVVTKDVHQDHAGNLVRTMYAYGKPNSRIRTEVHATPMPPPILAMGDHLSTIVRHHLAEVCKSSPPNHCQMLAYYGLFGSEMGLHKDDHTIDDFHSVLFKDQTLEEAAQKSKGAMVPGSDVLIYTDAPMTPGAIHFHHPPKGYPFAPREHYVTYYGYTYCLDHGTLLLFKAVDDVNFFHSTGFYNEFDSVVAQSLTSEDHRFAFVFRWLGPESEAEFPADSCP